jgi:uncharacterized protein YjeT (DUF2065 family)
MDYTFDPTAWSALMLGLLALFAGIGAWRQPGLWTTMVKEISGSPALQLVSAMVELVVGALIYLINPWVPADLLACVMKAIGGFLILEALMVAGFCDLYLHFWLKNLGHLDRRWAAVTMIYGLVLIVPAALRFH